MMGADELLKAAQTLRQRAAAAAPPFRDDAWEAFRQQTRAGHMTVGVALNTEESVFEDRYCRPEVAEYIATMHPGVGLALAGWLESQATDASEVMHYAYDIARLINGGAE